ncbi:MAG: GNAT family N-acetyltransferase [Acidimicrobiales bacterium]
MLPLPSSRPAERAHEARCLFAQLQVPASKAGRTRQLLAADDVPCDGRWDEGLLFRTGNVPNQLLTVDLRSDDGTAAAPDEVLLQRFRSRTRRDVRASLRTDLEIERPVDDATIRIAYGLIEENGREHGYATRSWADLGPTILAQVATGEAVIHLARADGEPVGAHYGVIAGRRLTYMMGGTRRLHPDPHVGHFLHWQVMVHARSLGLDGYDLTTYGNAGVRRFKEGFQPTLEPFVEARHLVLRRAATAAFLAGYDQLRSRKATTARWARRLRSVRGPHR